jgi:hypothetical protein
MAVASVWRTSSEAFHACATMRAGSQVGWEGLGLESRWMLRVIWESEVRSSRYSILPYTCSIWPRMFVSSRSIASASFTLSALS